MSSKRKRAWLLVLSSTCVVCALAACTLSLPGGVIGGIVALLLAGGLLFGAGFSQSGCESAKTQPCLSVACLSPDGSLGPCLDPPAPDGRVDACLSPRTDGPQVCLSIELDAAADGPLGPCLDPPQPDGAVDGPIGPCLDPLPPDGAVDGVHVCLSIIDEDGGIDTDVGPCLAPPPRSFEAAAAPQPPSGAAASSPHRGDRIALIAALEEQGRLPADVLDRLKQGWSKG